MNWRNYGSDGDTELIPFEGADGTTTAPAVPAATIIAPPPVVEEPLIVEGSIPDSAFIAPPPVVEEPLVAEKPIVVEEPLVAEKPIVVEEPPVVEQPPAAVRPPEIEEPLAPEPPPTGGIAADFADLKEATPEAGGWTPGHGGTPQEEGPLYSSEPGHSIDRLADRQGELPDQRFAGMRAPYPAPESPAEAEPPAPRHRVIGGPLAAAAGLETHVTAPAEMEVDAVEAEPDVVAAPAPAKRKRRRSRRSRKRSVITSKRLAVAGIVAVVLVGGGFAALKLPAILSGDRNAATVRRPLEGTEGPAMAVAGGLETEGQGVDAAGLGAVGATTEPITDTPGGEAVDGTLPASGDSAAGGDELLVDAEVLGDSPSMPPAGDGEDPNSVADEVARLAKPLPDRAYAAPVLAIDGTVVELNDERARRAAARRRAQEQAVADSNAGAQMLTIRRPVVTAPAPVAGDAGLDVSIDRPELLQKLDRLSDSLSAALNTYFVETLALQNDEGSCDSVTEAFDRVSGAWKGYAAALGSPRVVTFEGARAARDVQLSERVQEVRDSYSSLDCDR